MSRPGATRSTMLRVLVATTEVEGEARAIIPRLIRLFSAEEGTIWLARVEPSARPLLTDEDVE